MPTPLPKKVGRYQLLCHLATGGMAEVWIATGPNSRKDPLICVKLMLAGLERDQDFLTMFIEEAKLAAPLAHRNLVQIDDLGVGDGRLYLAMEYIRGHPLSAIVKALRARQEVLAPELAASLVAQACRGLDFAHNYRGPDGRPLGLVHRDVSPQNLILGFDGTVKVVDFGIAKATSRSGTRTGSMKGKLGYMAPEQIYGKGIDRRTDVFALGVTLWELATGARLFGGANDAEVIVRILTNPIPDPRMVAPDLPEVLVRKIMRGVSRRPEERYQTAAEMADDLEELASGWLEVPPEQALAELAAELFPPLPQTVEEAMARGRATPRRPTGSLLHLDDVEVAAAPAPTPSPAPVGTWATRADRGAPVAADTVSTATADPEAPETLSLSQPVEALEPVQAATQQLTAMRATPRWRTVAVVGAAVLLGAGIVASVGLWYLRPSSLGTANDPSAGSEPALPSPGRLADAAAPPLALPSPQSAAGAAGPLDDASRPDSAQSEGVGFLSLRTNPWSKVFLGQTELGTTPLVTVAVPAGRHVLRLRNDRKGSFLLPVHIRSGEATDPGVVRLDSLAKAP